MARSIFLKTPVLWIPVETKQPHRRLDVYADGRKIREFMVPDGGADQKQEGDCVGYYGKLALPGAVGKEVILKGEVSEDFLNAIRTDEEMKEIDSLGEQAAAGEEPRPSFHFTAVHGWINDPNGLIYADGLFHYYFQYNPFDTEWQNMSWGHAVSRDLLHWRQEETVMSPDEDGPIFSGSAVENQQGLLGQPQEALLYFYTAAGGSSRWSAGKTYIQKMAYSVDGGFTLHSLTTGRVDSLARENRDPKVFWHEETRAYVMILWVEGDTFAILRSGDLMSFRESQRFHLEEGFECPDLFRLTANGREKWVVMTAKGHYYPGSFDGFRFVPDGFRGELYLGDMQYAAQTYSGINDRCVMIPWLRMNHPGRTYRGAAGLPKELEGIFSKEGSFLVRQKPVREYERLRRECTAGESACEMELLLGEEADFSVKTGGICISYNGKEHTLEMGDECWNVGKTCRKIRIFVDDTILEASIDDGRLFGAAELLEPAAGFELLESHGVERICYFHLNDSCAAF